MKFLLDLDVKSEDAAGREITPEQFREHLQTYQFGTNVSFEMSLVPNDPDHELGKSGDYIPYSIKSATVTVVE